MYKKTFQLLGIITLLILSFIYTNKVFSLVKEKDPIIKQIKKYKKENDRMPKEAKVYNGTIKIGSKGKIINVDESYNNMKDSKTFKEDKIVYDEKAPQNTITNNYSYYIKQGNPDNKYVALMFRVEDETNLGQLLYLSNKYKVIPNLFVDGKYLLNNVDTFLSVTYPIYNSGYNGEYDKKTIKITNELINNLNNNNSIFCLNENKIVEDKKTCEKLKMYSITPELINPTIKDIKTKLSNGLLIMYDLNNFDINKYHYTVNIIKSKGYELVDLKRIIKE